MSLRIIIPEFRYSKKNKRFNSDDRFRIVIIENIILIYFVKFFVILFMGSGEDDAVSYTHLTLPTTERV